MAPESRVRFWLLFMTVLLLPVWRASAEPARGAATQPPAGFTEGVWIRKNPGNFACFKLETPGGLRVMTDPFAMDETISVDMVTESHQDADHIDTSRLTGAFTVLREPVECQVKGIRITGIPGKHNKGDAGVTNTIFVFEIDGIRIAHFASQGAPLGEEALLKLGRVDVLMIQGFESESWREMKLTVEDCRRIIDRLHPHIVIPEHGTPRFGEILARWLGTHVEYAPAEGIVVTRRDLERSELLRIVDMDSP